MPPVAPGKVQKHWYIDEDLVRDLRLWCAEENKKESHVVNDLIGRFLRTTKPNGLQGQAP